MNLNGVIIIFFLSGSDLCCFPVLFLCAFVAERKVMIPSLKMLFVSCRYFTAIVLHSLSFSSGLLCLVYWACSVTR